MDLFDDDESRAPLLQYRSKTDLVTEYLRREIQSGRPKAGERLVVARVAQQLGVSKVPVRESVTRLIGEGVLVLRPNVGPVVRGFTAHEVIETAMLRVAIERLALTTAVPLHDEASLAKAQEVLDRMAEDGADFPALNVAFHMSLLEPSPYREVVRLCGSLLNRVQRYRTAYLVPGYRPDAHNEHLQLFECVRTGDLDKLLELNESHIESGARRLTRQMEAGTASETTPEGASQTAPES